MENCEKGESSTAFKVYFKVIEMHSIIHFEKEHLVFLNFLVSFYSNPLFLVASEYSCQS